MKRKKLLGYFHLPTYSTEKHVEILKEIENKVRKGWTVTPKRKSGKEDTIIYNPHPIKITPLETSLDGCGKYIMEYPEYDDITKTADMALVINAAFGEYILSGDIFKYNSTNTIRLVDITEDGDITNRAKLDIVNRHVTSTIYEEAHTKCVFRYGSIIEDNIKEENNA